MGGADLLLREKMQRKSKKGLTIRKKESIIHEVKQRRSSASHLIAWANRVNTVSKAGVYSVFLCAADFFRRFFFFAGKRLRRQYIWEVLDNY